MSDIFNYTDLKIFSQDFASRTMKSFTSEDIRSEWISLGYPLPIDNNVFGPIMREMAKEKRIYEHGYEKAKIITSASRRLIVWISREYRLKQQQNATGPKPLSLFN